jgi:hypothetical protein
MRGAGQPIHFLERLIRVPPQQAALASLLARDALLMRQFLEAATARDPTLASAERVALPLDASPTPAHLILARDGHAVTCLSSDMPVQDAPKVPFAWVSQLATELDAAFAGATALRRAEASPNNVLVRLRDDAAALTLADLQQLRALVPLLGDALVECVQQASELFRGEPLPLRASSGAAARASLWQVYVRGAHALTLGGARAFPTRSLVLHAATPDVFLSSRAGHAAVHRGAECLDVLEALARDHNVLGAEHELGVAAALVQPMLVGRARGLLRSLRHKEGGGYLELLQKALDEPRSALERAFVALLPLLPSLLTPERVAADERLSAGALSAAQRAVGDTTRMTAKDVATRLHKALPPLVEAMLQDAGASGLVHWRRFLHRTPLRLNALPLGTLLLSRVPADAFLPDAREGLPEFSVANAESYVEHVVPAFRPAAAAASAGAAPPGPNSACPCGSGRKFKKCHGAPR